MAHRTYNSLMQLLHTLMPYLTAGLLHCATLTHAQQMQTIPNFHNLPGPVVHKLIQDEEGYMWYATTESGLCRDNGYQIDIFVGDSASGFSHSDRFVNELCLTRNHQILFSTATGAWILDKHTYHIERLDTTVTMGRNVESIVGAHDGSFWLTSGSWAYHLDQNRRLLRSFEIQEDGHQQPGLTLYEDSANRLWLMLHQGGLRLYNPRTDEFEACSWDYEYPPLCMLEDQQRHCYWLGTIHGGIVRYTFGRDARKGTVTSYPISWGQTALEHEQRGFVFGLCLQDNLLWASAMDNLYCYAIRDTMLQTYNTSHFLPSQRKVLERPCLDKHGNLWVPSFTPNPFVITPVGIDLHRYGVEKMEPLTGYPIIADIIESEGDGFWLLQSRIGLMFYRPADQWLSLAPSTSEFAPWQAVDLLERSANGGVWVKDSERLLHAQMAQGRIHVKEVSRLDSPISVVCELTNGTLLVGTSDAIWSINPATGHKRSLCTKLGYVSQICQTPDGELYFLSQYLGLAHLSENGTATSLSRQYDFNKIAADHQHRLWLSSTNGTVASFNTLTHELTTDPFISNANCVIKRLCVDAADHVWLLTSLYVREYSPQTGSYRTFNVTDSNLRMDYLQDLKVHGRDVCFCGAGAICTLRSSDVLEQANPHINIVATDIAANGHRQHLHFKQTEVSLPHTATQVLVYLSTFDLMNAGKLSFAYSLSSDKSEWNYLPIGNNAVPLSNLSRGSHKLYVRVLGQRGQWSTPQLVLTIRRQPAWWETWWAYIIYLSLGCSLLTLGTRFLLRRQARHHEAEMEQRLTDLKFRFFTNVSHELRTPLTLIITPLTSLINQQPEGPLRQKLNGILGHAQELLQLINNLLSFRKLELGQTKLNLRYGDLNEFLREACTSFQPLYDKHGISLRFVPSPSAMNIYFDKYIMHHVLFNLLSNAQKFTPAGGDVCVSLCHEDKHVRISVADTGCGIPANQLARIFDRFYQGDGSNATAQEGSGIGLNMVRELVTIHGGSVSVDSRVDEGSTFTVKIPYAQHGTLAKEETPPDTSNADAPPAQESRTASTTSAKMTPTSTILLAEDNDDFRTFVADELSAHYHVLQAADGNTALALIQSEQIDVVVSDVMMPGTDGIELCKRLKQDEQTNHIPIILLTARAAQESELEGYQAGADYYITKPFDMDILLNRLQQIELQKTRRQQELMQHLEAPDVQQIFTNERDKELMGRVIQLMEQHLGEEEYGRYELSSDLCMTYITVYRKIKALTGLAPAEFMRSYRLRQACPRLRSTQTSIADIAMQVGFSSPSYFTSCFAKEFGQTPSEYRRAAMDHLHSMERLVTTTHTT